MPLEDAALARKARIREASSSVFNYWFGYVANLSLVGWLGSRALVSGHPRLGLGGWAFYASAGLLLWTLSEYILHRYLYHVMESPLKVGHDLHHEEPRSLLGVPWWITTIVIVGMYYGLSQIANPAVVGVVMASAWLGYVGYCAMHHAFHHATWRAKWFVSARRHHMIHHARHNVNWGVTTSLWDRLFGTRA